MKPRARSKIAPPLTCGESFGIVEGGEPVYRMAMPAGDGTVTAVARDPVEPVKGDESSSEARVKRANRGRRKRR